MNQPTQSHQPGHCYCCGQVLAEGRTLWCLRCADPKGFVNQAARMLRGKYLRG